MQFVSSDAPLSLNDRICWCVLKRMKRIIFPIQSPALLSLSRMLRILLLTRWLSFLRRSLTMKTQKSEPSGLRESLALSVSLFIYLTIYLPSFLPHINRPLKCNCNFTGYLTNPMHHICTRYSSSYWCSRAYPTCNVNYVPLFSPLNKRY